MSWKSVIDVTVDKKILKKIEKSGEGFERPNEGSQVKGSLMSHKHNSFIYVCKHKTFDRKLMVGSVCSNSNI